MQLYIEVSDPWKNLQRILKEMSQNRDKAKEELRELNTKRPNLQKELADVQLKCEKSRLRQKELETMEKGIWFEKMTLEWEVADEETVSDERWQAVQKSLMELPGADVPRRNVIKNAAASKIQNVVRTKQATKILLDVAGSENDSSDQVRELIAKGAKVNAVDKYGKSALHRAVAKGNLEILVALLDAGADVNAVDEYAKRPLHWAAVKGDLEIMKALLDAGADVNAVDKTKWSALHYAALRYNSGIVEALLDAGADITAKTEDGIMANWIVKRTGKSSKTLDNTLHKLKAMRELKGMARWIELVPEDFGKDSARVHAVDETGNSMLHWAIIKKDKKFMSKIIGKVIDFNRPNKGGDKPLDLAANNGNKDAAKELLKNGANVKDIKPESKTKLANMGLGSVNEGTFTPEEKVTGRRGLNLLFWRSHKNGGGKDETKERDPQV